LEEANVEHDAMRFDDEDRQDVREAGNGQGRPDTGPRTPGGDADAPRQDEKELRLAPLDDKVEATVAAERAVPMQDQPTPMRPARKIRLSRRQWAFLITGAVIVAAVVLGAIFLVPVLKNANWTGSRALAIYIALGVLATTAGGWLLLRKTLRTRMAVEKDLREDPDINDWLVVFDWTPKVLYVPTIAAAFIAAILMYLEQGKVWFFADLDTAAVGGIWFLLFFLNFIIEEYNINVKMILIGLVGFGCFLLWLHLLGGVCWFFRLFTNLAISMSGTGFLLIGVFGVLTIAVSWFKGLFYYVSLTPNYMNIQEGPTESGEQISREDYNSRVDTSDFMERLMGFGRIIITFKDQKRQPITLLVWQVQKKAKYLERVRGKIAIDQMMSK